MVDAYTYRNNLAFVNDCRSDPSQPMSAEDEKIRLNAAAVQVVMDNMPLVVFYTIKKVKRGEQLFIDYGDGYWKDARADQEAQQIQLGNQAKVQQAQKEVEKAQTDLKQKKAEIVQMRQQLKHEASESDDLQKRLLQEHKKQKQMEEDLKRKGALVAEARQQCDYNKQQMLRERRKSWHAERERQRVAAEQSFAERAQKFALLRDSIGGTHEVVKHVKCTYCPQAIPVDSLAQHYAKPCPSKVHVKEVEGASAFKMKVHKCTYANHKNEGKVGCEGTAAWPGPL